MIAQWHYVYKVIVKRKRNSKTRAMRRINDERRSVLSKVGVESVRIMI